VAVFLGILFALVFAFAPSRGLVAEAVRRWKQKREFHETMLAIHLLHHEGTPEEADEARCDGLHKHFSWTATWVAGVVRRSERRGLVRREGELLKLTEDGRERARTMLNL
jgi:manganese/zinc/iron transport system permease protein